jgi:biotin carboxyl carrier protein
MTTPTLESTPEQAEQKKQTDPPGAKPDPAESARLAVTDTAKPTVADGANPAAAESAKPDPAESEKKAADEKAKQAADEKTKQATTRRRLILMIVAGVVLIAAAILIWKIVFAPPRIPNSIVVVSGRIEGDDSAVASKTTGRVLEVRVREGDTVNAGDTIAVLDDAQIRAREDQARDALSDAEAKGAAAQEQIAVLQEQLQQSRMQVGQSKLLTRLDSGIQTRHIADLVSHPSIQVD